MSLITAGQTAFNIYRGYPMELKHLVLDENGEPMDVSDAVVVLRIAPSLTDTYSLLEIEGDFVTNGTDGKVSFFLSSEDTRKFLVGAYTISTVMQTEHQDDYPAYVGRIGVIGVAPPAQEGEV